MPSPQVDRERVQWIAARFAGTPDQRLATLRQALWAWRDLADHRTVVDDQRLLGTSEELDAAAAILHRGFQDALHDVEEADIEICRARGYLTADEARLAVKEKRLLELDRERSDQREERGRER